MSKELFENLRKIANDGYCNVFLHGDGSGSVFRNGSLLFTFTDLEDLVAKLAMETV